MARRVVPLATISVSLSTQALHAQAPSWFVPPPPNKGSLAEGPHVDIQQVGSTETIVVRAKKKPIQRDPHGEEDHEFQPLHSDAAGPEPSLPNQSYCQSAYQTVGGQAATGADLIGSAAGHCD